MPFKGGTVNCSCGKHIFTLSAFNLQSFNTNSTHPFTESSLIFLLAWRQGMCCCFDYMKYHTETFLKIYLNFFLIYLRFHNDLKWRQWKLESALWPLWSHQVQICVFTGIYPHAIWQNKQETKNFRGRDAFVRKYHNILAKDVLVFPVSGLWSQLRSTTPSLRYVTTGLSPLNATRGPLGE